MLLNLRHTLSRVTHPFHHLRNLSTIDSSASSSNRLITTPIFYVNAQPHIGHLHSALLADAATRWHRMKGTSVLFTTGTDEHGLKVQEAAEAKQVEPKLFCDQVSTTFRDAFDAANIQADRFVRTTDPDHAIAVHTMWQRLVESGDLYCGTHEGWYCASDEIFLPENQIKKTENNKTGTVTARSIESGKKLRWVSEENWKFRLSAYEDRLLDWIDGNNGNGKKSDASLSPVKPKERVNEVKQLINSGLKDISVSRLREKVPWALPVPNDENHSIYVWVDALTNYLTVTGYGTTWGNGNGNDNDNDTDNAVNSNINETNQGKTYWPAHCHIIGKDILRFHAVYWPAFLMAANLPLPSSIVAHGHWTTSRVKMSKSLGNVVAPQDIINDWGIDPVRYFFLRDGSLSNDSDFSEINISVRYVSELADTLGNLVSRCTGKSLLPNRTVNNFGPGMKDHPFNTSLTEKDLRMIQQLEQLTAIVDTHYNNFEFNLGLDAIMTVLRDANGYFSDEAPWSLRKTIRENEENGGQATDIEMEQQRLDIVVYISIECIRITSLLLQPIIPESSSVILDHIDVNLKERTVNHANQYGRGNLHGDVQGNEIDGFESFEVGAKNLVLFDKKAMAAKVKEVIEKNKFENRLETYNDGNKRNASKKKNKKKKK